jgi:hypothetical protein
MTGGLVTIDRCGWSIEHASSIHPGGCHGEYRDLSAPLLSPVLFDMGLRRFSLHIDRLLAMTMPEVGMVRRFLVSVSVTDPWKWPGRGPRNQPAPQPYLPLGHFCPYPASVKSEDPCRFDLSRGSDCLRQLWRKLRRRSTRPSQFSPRRRPVNSCRRLSFGFQPPATIGSERPEHEPWHSAMTHLVADGSELDRSGRHRSHSPEHPSETGRPPWLQPGNHTQFRHSRSCHRPSDGFVAHSPLMPSHHPVDPHRAPGDRKPIDCRLIPFDWLVVAGSTPLSTS